MGYSHYYHVVWLLKDLGKGLRRTEERIRVRKKKENKKDVGKNFTLSTPPHLSYNSLSVVLRRITRFSFDITHRE